MRIVQAVSDRFNVYRIYTYVMNIPQYEIKTSDDDNKCATA